MHRVGIGFSLSQLVEEYLEGLDGESFVDGLCSELGIDCRETTLDPNYVVSARPKSLGGPASELVRELRDERARDISRY